MVHAGYEGSDPCKKNYINIYLYIYIYKSKNKTNFILRGTLIRELPVFKETHDDFITSKTKSQFYFLNMITKITTLYTFYML